MGGSVSRNEDFTQNDLLKRFVGKDSIPVEDTEFWKSLLSYTIALPTNRYGWIAYMFNNWPTPTQVIEN